MFGFLHNGPTLFDRAFLPSSRVLKNRKSLLKYVGRKVGSSSTGVHLADQTRMLAAVVEPESVVCATSLEHLRMVSPCGCLFGIQESPQRSRGKRSALPFAISKVLLPQEGASHIYILITYHSPTQPIGNPYPPSKNLVL
jgi:hypothetical protein